MSWADRLGTGFFEGAAQSLPFLTEALQKHKEQQHQDAIRNQEFFRQDTVRAQEAIRTRFAVDPTGAIAEAQQKYPQLATELSGMYQQGNIGNIATAQTMLDTAQAGLSTAQDPTQLTDPLAAIAKAQGTIYQATTPDALAVMDKTAKEQAFQSQQSADQLTQYGQQQYAKLDAEKTAKESFTVLQEAVSRGAVLPKEKISATAQAANYLPVTGDAVFALSRKNEISNKDVQDLKNLNEIGTLVKQGAYSDAEKKANTAGYTEFANLLHGRIGQPGYVDPEVQMKMAGELGTKYETLSKGFKDDIEPINNLAVALSSRDEKGALNPVAAQTMLYAFARLIAPSTGMVRPNSILQLEGTHGLYDKAANLYNQMFNGQKVDMVQVSEIETQIKGFLEQKLRMQQAVETNIAANAVRWGLNPADVITLPYSQEVYEAAKIASPSSDSSSTNDSPSGTTKTTGSTSASQVPGSLAQLSLTDLVGKYHADKEKGIENEAVLSELRQRGIFGDKATIAASEPGRPEPYFPNTDTTQIADTTPLIPPIGGIMGPPLPLEPSPPLALNPSAVRGYLGPGSPPETAAINLPSSASGPTIPMPSSIETGNAALTPVTTQGGIQTAMARQALGLPTRTPTPLLTENASPGQAIIRSGKSPFLRSTLLPQGNIGGGPILSRLAATPLLSAKEIALAQSINTILGLTAAAPVGIKAFLDTKTELGREPTLAEVLAKYRTGSAYAIHGQ